MNVTISMEELRAWSEEMGALRVEANRAKKLDEEIIKLQGEIGDWKEQAYRLGSKASVALHMDRNVTECRVQIDETLLMSSRCNPRELIVQAFLEIADQFELRRFGKR
jgi:hypothetical protein